MLDVSSKPRPCSLLDHFPRVRDAWYMMSDTKSASDILLQNYDRMLFSHGDSARGANWPNDADRRIRFDVMLDVIASDAEAPTVLCDLGCGTGELFAHIREKGLRNITYIGVDRSAAALSYARAKFPDAIFIEIDVNSAQADLAQIACDYLVANGLFTVKWEMTDDQMWSFLKATISRVWPLVRRGVAFNVMSKIVDWKRDDLFHLAMDDAARFLHELAGRRVRLRADYGLFEYTAFAYKPDKAPAQAVPVFRPQLPRCRDILTYLRRIDTTRIYSNHGPLLLELERGLSRCLGMAPGSVKCASSGTNALIGAILAAAGRATALRPFAIVPAFTFVATAAAAEQCGYQLYLADVDANSWLLDPETVIRHPMREHIGLVIPVATFGRPVPQAPWQAFREKTEIPVVIDGAASFAGVANAADAFLGNIPVALSLHATKCFATGEGGAVVSCDTDLVVAAAQALNFGFAGSRDSRTASTNGKMSEYHAAVGLAELDGWDDKLRAFAAVAESYRRRMADAGLLDFVWSMPAVAPNYVLLRCQSVGESESVQNRLRQARIDFRLWYGGGLHHQTYFANAPRGSLEVTENLAPRVLGLPVAPDLTKDTIERVVATVKEGISKAY
jgi:dTDP-4-amino-4,6-dideoxygalactose transaminase/SAM-dependent methyltransferase